MTEKRVQQFYTEQVTGEWRRLVKDPYRRLEFETTLRFLEKYLPPQGLILDAGGGPGRYTIELAKRGYDMVLHDFTPANLEFALRRIKRARVRRRIRQIVEGSIVDLSPFPDDSFNAVLCTGGPLSHVLDPQERARAISELVRVTKPGAPLFVSVMSRLSVMVVVLTQSPYELEMPHFKLMRDTGDYLGEHGFTACHFFYPEELREAFAGQNVDILEMAGLEGISSNHRRFLNQAAKNQKRWQEWLETHYQTCTHPAVVGTSEHMLIICRKRKTS